MLGIGKSRQYSISESLPHFASVVIKVHYQFLSYLLTKTEVGGSYYSLFHYFSEGSI